MSLNMNSGKVKLSADMEASISEYELDLLRDGLDPEVVDRKVANYRWKLEEAAAPKKARRELG